MDLKELNHKFLNAGVITDDIRIIFKTPDGHEYNICECNFSKYSSNPILIVNLIDNVKPNFAVGDRVTSIDGLFPEVGYTIEEVNEKEQYYTYKEVFGKTYFKDQNKLILVKSDNSTPPRRGRI